MPSSFDWRPGVIGSAIRNATPESWGRQRCSIDQIHTPSRAVELLHGYAFLKTQNDLVVHLKSAERQGIAIEVDVDDWHMIYSVLWVGAYLGSCRKHVVYMAFEGTNSEVKLAITAALVVNVHLVRKWLAAIGIGDFQGSCRVSVSRCL